MFDYIQHLVLEAGAWGALGFFVGAILEELGPVPSPLLLIGAAFFVGKPITVSVVLSILFKVIIPIVSGATIGSLIIYYIAYVGGHIAIVRWGKWIKVNLDDLEKMEKKLSSHKVDKFALFFSRCLPFTPTTLLTVLAGIFRMDIYSYVVLTFVGIFIRVTGLFIGALIFSGTFFT